MRLQEILNLNSYAVRRISTTDLRKIVRQAEIVANKRIRNLEVRGLANESRAYQTYRDKILNGELILARGSGRMRDVYNLKLLQRFLSTSTSTVKGARAYIKQLNRRLPNLNDNNRQRFWEAYHKLQLNEELKYRAVDSKDFQVKLGALDIDAYQTDDELYEALERALDEQYDYEDSLRRTLDSMRWQRGSSTRPASTRLANFQKGRNKK